MIINPISRDAAGNLIVRFVPGAPQLLVNASRRSSSNFELRRPAVSEVQGDIFDSLELEMGNDAVAAGARAEVEDNSSMWSRRMAEADASTMRLMPVKLLVGVDEIGSFVAWLNFIYCTERARTEPAYQAGVSGGGNEITDLPLAAIIALFYLDVVLKHW